MHVISVTEVQHRRHLLQGGSGVTVQVEVAASNEEERASLQQRLSIVASDGQLVVGSQVTRDMMGGTAILPGTCLFCHIWVMRRGCILLPVYLSHVETVVLVPGAKHQTGMVIPLSTLQGLPSNWPMDGVPVMQS